MTLIDIPEDKMVHVKSVTDDISGSRLHEMGFYKDQEVTVLGKAPFGDPLAVRVGNSTIMLRKREAASVSVEMNS